MSKGNDAALRLVVVDDSVEDAEAIVSGLRNAGIAIRPQRPATPRSFPSCCPGRPSTWCWLRAGRRRCPSTRPRNWSRAAARDIPLLALFDDVDATGVSAAIAAGGARSPCATTPSSCTR